MFEWCWGKPQHPTKLFNSWNQYIDVSTSILPENTWIFLDQHHEVGNNDIVLNLVQAIIEGKVSNVNYDPVNYPQFNYSCNTKYIRRWRIPDAQGLLTNEEDEFELTPEQIAELEAAIAKGEEVLKLTVVDQKKIKEAEDELNAVLAKYGMYTYPEEPSGAEKFFGDALESTSKFLVDTIGGGSLVDWILSPARNLIGKIFG